MTIREPGVDPSVRPLITFLMGPLFVLVGVYMIKSGPLPGQTRSLHLQLGGTAILVGLVIISAGLFMPSPVA